jgi:clan AA aspartic protease
VLSVDRTKEETIEALVDTGASYTLLPSVMLRRMGVVPQRRLEFELANGEIMEHDVGEARIRIDGVEATSIVVFGDDAASPRLGADALQSVSMVVDPVNKNLAPTRALLMSPVARHTGAS